MLVTISHPASVTWAPLVAVPIALLGWLALFCWIARFADGRSPLGRRLSVWRFELENRLRRRSRMRASVARANARLGNRAADLVLPQDETVRWVALWAVEIYLPTHVPSLRRALTKLGWTRESFKRGSVDAEEWLNESRPGAGLAWMRLGFFRPRTAKYFPTAIPIDLPDSFAFLDLALVQLGHGVTALVANFALAEDEQTCLEEVLRRPLAARAELSGAGHRIRSAELVRAECIAAERNRIRDMAATWIARNLPGAFAMRDEHPAMWDFMTSEKADMIRAFRSERGWQDALGFRGAARWRMTSGTSRVSLGIPTSFMDESNPVPTFVGCRQPLIDGLGEGHGDSIYSVVQSLDDDLSHLLPLWGTVRAVTSYDRQLSMARDQQLPRRAGYRRTRFQLQRLREVIIPAARDLVTLEELGGWLDDREVQGWFQRGSADLAPSSESEGPSMVEWLAGRLARESTQVRQRADNDVRSLQAYSDTLVAASNLRLQLTVLGLSVVVAILTAVTIVLAVNRDSGTIHSRGEPSTPASTESR